MDVRYYDGGKDRLVYIKEKATAEFWARRWEDQNFRSLIVPPTPTHDQKEIITTTRKYLRPGARVLEAGCGYGDKVYALRAAGFNVTGLDYAESTIAAVKAEVPDLDLCVGDVFQLPYDAEVFDGIWSLGVIEHFYEGYDGILTEMLRVLKPNGCAFVTFPALSRLRRTLVRLGLIKTKPASDFVKEPEGFYQFAMTPQSVIDRATALGFKLADSRPWNGGQGLIRDVPALTLPVKVGHKIAPVLLESALASWANHMNLIVLRKP